MDAHDVLRAGGEVYVRSEAHRRDGELAETLGTTQWLPPQFRSVCDSLPPLRKR